MSDRRPEVSSIDVQVLITALTETIWSAGRDIGRDGLDHPDEEIAVAIHHALIQGCDDGTYLKFRTTLSWPADASTF